ncbi:MAG: hypothetical protein GY838_09215, partial [bacterium]|nr:hypothetical protein [bacterium]
LEPLDYGDAPAPYWTTSGSLGASHFFCGPRLGYNIDVDADGQPSLDAMGDDINGVPDDEDGVYFLNDICQNCWVQTDVVMTGTTAYLWGWIDFNQDGDWNDVNDQIFDTQLLSPGTNNLGFMVPGDAVVGDTYARFRLSESDSGFPADGPDFNCGEVEDYLVTVELEPLDYGDAPAPYWTTSGSLGASHFFCGPRLGYNIDVDADGQPSLDA